MKMIIWSTHQHTSAVSGAITRLASAIAGSLGELVVLGCAILTSSLVVMLAAWLTAMEFNAVIGASVWGVGFIFLAMAIDGRGRLALLQSISGGAFLILAMLQNSVSTGFGIIAGVLLSIWVGALVYKRLSFQTV